MTNKDFALNKVRKDIRESDNTSITSALLTGVYNRFFSESELHKIGSYEGNIVEKLATKVIGNDSIMWQLQKALANM